MWAVGFRVLGGLRVCYFRLEGVFCCFRSCALPLCRCFQLIAVQAVAITADLRLVFLTSGSSIRVVPCKLQHDEPQGVGSRIWVQGSGFQG